MKLAFYYWCICIVMLVCGQELSQSKMEEIDNDLRLYFKALNKVTNFSLIYMHYLDPNIASSTILVNMNLNKVLKERDESLPPEIKAQIETLLRKNNNITAFFNETAKHMTIIPLKTVTSLFEGDRWIDRIENFHDPLDKNSEPFLFYNKTYFDKRFTNWHKYMENIKSKDIFPNAEESDACLMSVTSNPINYSDDEKECDVLEYCRQYMHHGADFGYSLANRLLILLVANNGRGCYMISPEEDQQYKKTFCKDIYTESVYIEMNNYKLASLFAEQILFCSLQGHSEFMKRHWLTKLLSLQTKVGCFSKNENHRQALNTYQMGNVMLLDTACSSHLTMLVAATLSAAVRYLLEKFY